MTLFEQIENMSDIELKEIWNTFDKITWNNSTMYDKNITMDEWGMMIAAEIDLRKLGKSL
jgi:hypothetical protein